MPNSDRNGDYIGPTTVIHGDQTIIPKEVIDVLELESGMHLLWVINGKTVTVRQLEH